MGVELEQSIFGINFICRVWNSNCWSYCLSQKWTTCYKYMNSGILPVVHDIQIDSLRRLDIKNDINIR
jgi:hypothetical protein